jgi:hypothetical protein
LPQFGTLKINGEFKTEYNEDQLKYHKDWNWLMEVVEKIEGLNFFISIDSIGVVISKENTDIIKVDKRNKLSSTYQAVVEFIKLHNKQK